MNLNRVLRHRLALRRTTGVDADSRRSFEDVLNTGIRCRVVQEERTVVGADGEERSTTFRIATTEELKRGDRLWFTTWSGESMNPADPEEKGLEVVEVKAADNFSGTTKLFIVRA